MAFTVETTIVFENGDYSLSVTLSPVHSPIDGQALIITSKRKESRNPNEEQVRFMACLDREGLTKLGDLIQKQLAKRPDPRTPAQVAEDKRVMQEIDQGVNEVFKIRANFSSRDTN